MHRDIFEKSKSGLHQGLIDTIAAHFQALNLSFDPVAFISANQFILEHVVADAHFIGAEVFPIDIPIKTTLRD